MDPVKKQSVDITPLISSSLLMAITLVLTIQAHPNVWVEHGVEIVAIILLYRYFWVWSQRH